MIEHSPSIGALITGLHAAQAHFNGVAKDSKNPHFRNNYASLEAVVETAKKPLQEAGLAFTQAPGVIVENATEITTMLMHTSGEWLRSTLHVPLSKKDAQGVGSAITYGCRYALMATLGLPPVDDDGEEASKPEPRREAAPKKGAPDAVRTEEEPDLERSIISALIAAAKVARTVADLDDWKASDNVQRTFKDLSRDGKREASEEVAKIREGLDSAELFAA